MASAYQCSVAWLLVILFTGGFGRAAYNIYQATIVIESVPDAMRSRVFGLVTVGIGCWPIGTSLAGMPVRIFAGAGDKVVDPESQSARLHGVLPNSTLDVEMDAGHLVHYKIATLISAAVTDIEAQTSHLPMSDESNLAMPTRSTP